MQFRVTSRIHALQGERAQSLIETALVFPVLITVLIGAAEMARIARASISVSNAAKAAVQYGAQSAQSATDSTGIQTAASNEASNLTVVATSTVVCTCSSDGSVVACSSNNVCLSSHKVATLTVATQATVTPAMHLPGLPRSFTVRGSASERCLK